VAWDATTRRARRTRPSRHPAPITTTTRAFFQGKENGDRPFFEVLCVKVAQISGACLITGRTFLSEQTSHQQPNNRSAVFFSQNKPAPVISHQPNEQTAVRRRPRFPEGHRPTAIAATCRRPLACPKPRCRPPSLPRPRPPRRLEKSAAPCNLPRQRHVNHPLSNLREAPPRRPGASPRPARVSAGYSEASTG
jgi:hypothetical protein